jgi:hypothetical protein
VTQGSLKVWIPTLHQSVAGPFDWHGGLQGPALDELVVEIPDLHNAEGYDHLAVRQSHEWTRRTCSGTVRTSNKHGFRRGDQKVIQKTIASTEASFVHKHDQAALVSLDPLFWEQLNWMAVGAGGGGGGLVGGILRQRQKVFRYAGSERVVNRMGCGVTKEVSEEMAERSGAFPSSSALM